MFLCIVVLPLLPHHLILPLLMMIMLIWVVVTVRNIHQFVFKVTLPTLYLLRVLLVHRPFLAPQVPLILWLILSIILNFLCSHRNFIAAITMGLELRTFNEAKKDAVGGRLCARKLVPLKPITLGLWNPCLWGRKLLVASGYIKSNIMLMGSLSVSKLD